VEVIRLPRNVGAVARTIGVRAEADDSDGAPGQAQLDKRLHDRGRRATGT
jgi:hypothetical protein